MGNILQLNPFTEEGRANLRMYISDNRRNITIILAVCISLVSVTMFMIWWESDVSLLRERERVKPNFEYFVLPFCVMRITPLKLLGLVVCIKLSILAE